MKWVYEHYQPLVLWVFFTTLFVFALTVGLSACVEKKGQRTHDALAGMHYVKDPKSKQCFAINNNRMAWVPCSAVKNFLEPPEDGNED